MKPRKIPQKVPQEMKWRIQSEDPCLKETKCVLKISVLVFNYGRYTEIEGAQSLYDVNYFITFVNCSRSLSRATHFIQ